MKAATLHAARDLRVEDVAEPELEAVRACGLAGDRTRAMRVQLAL